MPTLRRLPVTLLELVIVMAILALVAGIVAISINKALIDQRFRTEVSMVVDELRLAQDLMLIFGTDVHVIFQEDSKRDGINYWIELETELPKNIGREVMRKHEKLKTVRGVFFEGNVLEEVHGKLDVGFLSGGAVMTKGIITLSTSEEEVKSAGILHNYICLPGYPKPIFSTDSYELAETFCSPAFDEDFNAKLTQDTVAKIPDSLKKPDEVQKEASSGKEEGKQKHPKNSRQNASPANPPADQ
jgi:hypothetical protein